jgi:hypothetical protein
MIDFYEDKKGNPINVRSLTKKLGAFQVTQGSTSDGKNIYMVFERRHHKGCSRRCRIVKLDASTLELKQVSDELNPVWNSQVNGKEIRFRINRAHPIVQSCLEDLSGADRDSVELLLKLVESGFPKDALFYELSKNPEDVGTPKMETSDVLDAAKRFYVALKASGQDDEHILDVMSSTEMFEEHWSEVSKALGIEEG